MERILIKDINQYLSQEIISFYLVTEKELRQGAKGSFLRLRVGDKGGSINAYIWDNAEHFANQVNVGDIVKVKGYVKDYKGQTQLTILNIRKSLEEEVTDLSDFIATTPKDPNQLSENLFRYIEGIENEFLKELLKNIFENTEFFTKYAKTPAAKNWHHNYVGGLLEHTVAVAKICEFASHQYPVDRDLLIAGALLHDIGKVEEYEVKATFEFTNIGRLVGHISIGDELIVQKARDINGFPPVLLMKLRHLILSHHGEIEKGAVKLPQTIEAIVLHYADNLDAQTTGVLQFIEAVRDETAEWSEFDRLNERYYFLK